MAKGTKYSQQFKEDAVQYRLDHPELPLRKASENLGVSESALKNWMKAAKEHKGEVLLVVREIMQVRKQKRLPDCSVNYEIRRMLLKC